MSAFFSRLRSLSPTSSVLTIFGILLGVISVILMLILGVKAVDHVRRSMEREPSSQTQEIKQQDRDFSLRSATTTNAQWKQLLTAEEYHILREEGTEAPFSSPLDYETRPGTYVSADCGEPLFRSEQKYDSGTGWPSFWAPINPTAVTLVEDKSLLLETRTEVKASKCGGHLGHVFDDGPPPTGKRYCMNGTALRFIPDEPTSSSTHL